MAILVRPELVQVQLVEAQQVGAAATMEPMVRTRLLHSSQKTSKTWRKQLRGEGGNGSCNSICIRTSLKESEQLTCLRKTTRLSMNSIS